MISCLKKKEKKGISVLVIFIENWEAEEKNMNKKIINNV